MPQPRQIGLSELLLVDVGPCRRHKSLSIASVRLRGLPELVVGLGDQQLFLLLLDHHAGLM